MQITRDASDVENRDGEHILMSLTYISRNNTHNSGVELTRILEKARRNNEENKITSVLAINDNYFIQTIEGSRPAINKLLAKLINDDRHQTFRIIDIQEIESRKWRGFSIKYLASGTKERELMFNHFSEGIDFNPYLRNQKQILSFINTLFEKEFGACRVEYSDAPEKH